MSTTGFLGLTVSLLALLALGSPEPQVPEVIKGPLSVYTVSEAPARVVVRRGEDRLQLLNAVVFSAGGEVINFLPDTPCDTLLEVSINGGAFQKVAGNLCNQADGVTLVIRENSASLMPNDVD